jgi:hypothetical protein
MIFFKSIEDWPILNLKFCEILPKQKLLIKKAQKRLKFVTKIRPNFGPLDSNFSQLPAQMIVFWAQL